MQTASIRDLQCTLNQRYYSKLESSDYLNVIDSILNILCDRYNDIERRLSTLEDFLENEDND